MVDSGPGEATTTTSSRKPFSVPEIPPLDRCDFGRAKIRASVRWLLCKSYGCAGEITHGKGLHHYISGLACADTRGPLLGLAGLAL
uniref:CASAMP N-terminal domain-containing protein n=1 Tax=Hippocampus comes TaxID=109280 RepID=A0A3Q2YY06_HIPCM